MLKKSLFLTTILSGSAALFFCIFPIFTIHLLLGSRYDAYAHLLPILTVAIFLASVGNLFGTYLVALHRRIAILPVVLGTLATIFCVIFAHTTIDQVMYGILIGSITICVGLAMIAFWPNKVEFGSNNA